MTECDAARVAEIEKAVVEQAHCYLPPRCSYTLQLPPQARGVIELQLVDVAFWFLVAAVIGGGVMRVLCALKHR